MDGLKEFFTYLTNQLKFWFIVKEWENGLQLRNGKILRSLTAGIYLKIPFLDFIYTQSARTQNVIISQVNFTTKDGKQITASCSAFFKIYDIELYYNGFAEPLSIFDNIINNQITKYFLNIDYSNFDVNNFENFVLNQLFEIDGIGVEFTEFNLISFSNAKTFRFIIDELYNQVPSNLDQQIF